MRIILFSLLKLAKPESVGQRLHCAELLIILLHLISFFLLLLVPTYKHYNW